MNDLPVTYGGIDYLDRLPPLLDGTVKPAGISLRIVPFTEPLDLFRRVAQHTDFDAAEMSFSTYTNLVSRGDDRYIAYHSSIACISWTYTCTAIAASVSLPICVEKSRIPVSDDSCALAAAFLQYDYGVAHVRYTGTGGLIPPASWSRMPSKSAGITIDLIPDSKPGRLTRGGLISVVFANRPAALLDGSVRVRRLFPNYDAIEQEYYRRTGFFPIMPSSYSTCVIKSTRGLRRA
jgi:4,5-dihydroxyphthalate decarboxylase